jgi:hypothetical protein
VADEELQDPDEQEDDSDYAGEDDADESELGHIVIPPDVKA